jgi:hypothetical protein
VAILVGELFRAPIVVGTKAFQRIGSGSGKALLSWECTDTSGAFLERFESELAAWRKGA